MKSLKLNTSKKVLSLLLGANTILLSGCNSDVECSVTEPHAHAYVDEYGIDRYVQSEKESYRSFRRTDSYILLSEEEMKLNQFEAKKDLIKIEDNLDKLIEMIANNYSDYYLYEYRYQSYESHRMGVHCYYRWEEKTGWTNNLGDIEICGQHKDLELTGNVLLAHYSYPTYKVVVNEKGKYEMVDGPVLDNIEDATSEYPYVQMNCSRSNFFSIVYLDVDEYTKEKLSEDAVKQLIIE